MTGVLWLLVIVGQIVVVDVDVRAAIDKYQQLEFGAVIPLLKGALERSDLSQTDREQALAYLARTYASFRKPRRAEKAFLELLGLDPDFEVAQSESPVIREALARARASLASADEPSPSASGPETEIVPSVPEPSLAVVATPTEAATPPIVEEREDWWRSPWWWVGVGVTVVVAGTVTVLVTEPWADDPRKVGSMGAWDLP